jgi:hypothetical protein
VDSKFKYFIISLLRKGSQRWKPAQQALNEAKEVYYIKSSTGKDLRRVKFKCVKCKEFYSRKEVTIDHIFPVVDPSEGFVGWERYIERMFPPKEGFQILCKGCDKIKCTFEREERKKFKNSVDKPKSV